MMLRRSSSSSRRCLSTRAHAHKQGTRIVPPQRGSSAQGSSFGDAASASASAKSGASYRPGYIPTLKSAGGSPISSFEPPAPEPGDLEDPFLKSLQALQRNLESQKAEIAEDLAEVVRTPEWKAYDREVEREIARLEDEWMRSQKPVTKESVAELQAAVSAKVDELTIKYQSRLDIRDEKARSFPQLLDDELKRNWEKLMKELGPPPPPTAPLTLEEFERAWRGELGPGTKQPPLPESNRATAAAIEGAATASSSSEALNDLKDLLAPVAAKLKSSSGEDKL